MPGVLFSAPRRRFSRLRFKALKSACVAKQVETESLATAFRSPALASGLPVTSAGSSFLAYRFASRVEFHSGSFGSWLLIPSVSSTGTNQRPKPVTEVPPGAFCISLCRRSPSGLSSLRIIGLSTAPTVASKQCAQLGTYRMAYRIETPDLSSLPAQLFLRLLDGSSVRVRYVPTGSLFQIGRAHV